MPVELFSVADARAFDKGQLADSDKYPDDVLTAHRDRIAEAFLNICGVAFVPTTVTEVLDGDGSDLLRLPHLRVTAVTNVETRDRTTWTAFTADELADILILRTGLIRREWLGAFPAGTQNVRVTYTHGYATPPLEITRAALKLLVSVSGAVASNLPDRATALSSPDGTFRLATPGMRGSFFGIPEVDAVLARYVERVGGIG